MQLQLHRSQITLKQSSAVPTASSAEVYCLRSSTEEYCYVISTTVYCSKAVQQYLVRTVQLHFIWARYSRGKVSISSTKLFA